MKYKNKLDFREYTIIVDNLLTGMEINVDYVNNLEKEGKNPLFTKGYIVREYEDLIEKVFGLMGKQDQKYIVKEQEVEFINNVKTRFNVEN
jgi:hypothetical protein